MIEISKMANCGRFLVYYTGNPKLENVKEEEVKDLLDAFLYQSDHQDMVNSVSGLRTIFKDYDEESLMVTIFREGGSEVVVYENGELFSYSKTVPLIYGRCEFTYDSSGLKCSYNDDNNNFEAFDTTNELFKYEIDTVMRDVSFLSNVKQKELSYEDKKLIEIYRRFYEEEPDFASYDINEKVQSMLCILSCFPSTKLNYTIDWPKESKYPESLSSRWNLNNLLPIGKIDNLEIENVLPNSTQRVIETIGNEVRGALGKKYDTRDLINLSKIMYLYMNYNNKNNVSDRMEHVLDCDLSQISLGACLVASLNNKIK